MKKKQKDCFKNFPVHVLIEKMRVKYFRNTDFLHELLFYDEVSVIKISQAFRRYARSYKIEIIVSKNPLAQLEASK